MAPTGWTLPRAMVVAGVAVFAFALIGLPVRADQPTRTTADEPQYLLSAISLWEDRDLDISDELSAARYAPFHEVRLPEQTKLLDDGRRVSPHDPLLPVVLAAPVGLFGWVGGKVAMAAMAGLLAASLVWVAVRRFAVPVPRAALVVVAFGCSPPLTAYATQVYPELPAALVVTWAIGALPLAAARSTRAMAVVVGAVVALPWLSVKYAPVAAVLAAALVGERWRARERRHVALITLSLLVSGGVFVAVHRVIYGGLTAYAAGDHFVGGELTVVGVSPDYLSRAPRLVGLLVDRWFGLAAWSPLYLLVPVALGSCIRRRDPGWVLLSAVAAAAWLNATFVAYTMHGWWWPGRQVVVGLPALVLLVSCWVGRLTRVAVVVTVVGGAAIGAGSWLWLIVSTRGGDATLITDFEEGASPWLSSWQAILPDGQVWATRDQVLAALWAVAISGSVVMGWWRTSDPRRAGPGVARQ